MDTSTDWGRYCWAFAIYAAKEPEKPQDEIFDKIKSAITGFGIDKNHKVLIFEEEHLVAILCTEEQFQSLSYGVAILHVVLLSAQNMATSHASIYFRGHEFCMTQDEVELIKSLSSKYGFEIPQLEIKKIDGDGCLELSFSESLSLDTRVLLLSIVERLRDLKELEKIKKNYSRLSEPPEAPKPPASVPKQTHGKFVAGLISFLGIGDKTK